MKKEIIKSLIHKVGTAGYDSLVKTLYFWDSWTEDSTHILRNDRKEGLLTDIILIKVTGGLYLLEIYIVKVK